VLLVPIRCHILRASAATIVHCYCIHVLSGTRWELLRTELELASHWLVLNSTELAHTELIQNWLENFPRTTYILSAPTTQKTPPLLLKRVYQSLHSNGRGADNSEPIVACVTQQRAENTHSSIVACVFRRFCVSAVPTWDKYTTIWLSVSYSLAYKMCTVLEKRQIQVPLRMF
jgi:hypothetical protein